jgi:coenzyme F420-reducing hydrogenase alpha subunit
VCLRRPDYYTFVGGEIASSAGVSVPVEHYQEAIKEQVVSHSTAKHARWNGESYFVGALARVNNNWRQLHPAAQQAMNTLGLKPPCHNTFMNTVAQVVEMVHCVDDSILLIDQVLALPLQEEWEPEVAARAGQGVGAAEAPRGLLIHDYTYDERGRCTRANCVIPTNQNLANLDADLRAFLAQLASKPEREIELGLEMLVRAYDPCISCSVH